MKTLFLFFFLLVAEQGFAQGFPVQSTIRTPYGDVKTTSYHAMPNHYMNYGGVTSSMKYQFIIEFPGDSLLEIKTKIDFSDKQHTIKIKTEAGKGELLPSHTKGISRITTAGKKISGVPADSCWLFKIFPGKINVYSFIPEEVYTSIVAIQDGNDNPIVPLTRENLEAIVGNLADPKILKLIENNKLIRAVQLYNKGN